DLLSGQVDLLVVQGAAALPQVRAGTIKAIANLSPQRSLSMADIPTSDEGGVPGLYMSGWFGFFAPKATPKGPRRSGGARALCRSRPRRCFAQAADPRGARRLSQRQNRKMVADHQNGEHKGGMSVAGRRLGGRPKKSPAEIFCIWPRALP